KRLVARCHDEGKRLWDSETGIELPNSAHADRLPGASYTSDGIRLFEKMEGNAVRVWRADNPTAPFVVRGYSGALQSFAISPNGKRLVTGGRDKTARVWKLSLPGR